MYNQRKYSPSLRKIYWTIKVLIMETVKLYCFSNDQFLIQSFYKLLWYKNLCKAAALLFEVWMWNVKKDMIGSVSSSFSEVFYSEKWDFSLNFSVKIY